MIHLVDLESHARCIKIIKAVFYLREVPAGCEYVYLTRAGLGNLVDDLQRVMNAFEVVALIHCIKDQVQVLQLIELMVKHLFEICQNWLVFP